MLRFRLSFVVSLATMLLVAACGKNPAPEPRTEPAVEKAKAEIPEATDAVEIVEETKEEPPAKKPTLTVQEAGGDAELGTLKMRFEYGVDAPEPKLLAAAKKDQYCGQFGLTSEVLLVHPKNKGIRNVVCYLYTGRGGSVLEEIPHEPAVVELANQSCRFEPRVVVLQPGDTLRVTNPDDVGHNANLAFFNNKQQNLVIPPKQHKDVQIVKDEPAPIPTDCNIHPWMRAYLVVNSHPFVGVSDENGNLTIEGLPVGEELVFRVFHEAGSINSVVVDGEDQEWKRSRVEIPIKAGTNDLGTVVIPEFP
ncbi:MAG: methylamine utilization protein [Rubripirellula sp.]